MPYVILALVLVGLFILALAVWLRFKARSTSVDQETLEKLASALGKDNITALDCSRNRVEAKLRNVREADLEAIKRAGAKGVNAVGPTVKFYFEADNDALCEALKAHLERME